MQTKIRPRCHLLIAAIAFSCLKHADTDSVPFKTRNDNGYMKAEEGKLINSSKRLQAHYKLAIYSAEIQHLRTQAMKACLNKLEPR